jgi:hypothetical protein
MKRLLVIAAAIVVTMPASPAAANDFSLTLSGPSTGVIGQPIVIQANGKNPPPEEYWFPTWLSVATIDSAVSPACPAYQPEAIQMSLATGGEWLAFTWREVVQADGSWSASMGYTPKRAGTWLVCGYTHDNVTITRAAASMSVTVAPASAPAPAPVAKPANAAPPRVTRSGRRLVCDPGRWTGATGGYAYRWSVGRDRRRGRTLVVTRGVRGRTVRCSVTASNAAGETTAASAPRRVR